MKASLLISALCLSMAGLGAQAASASDVLAQPAVQSPQALHGVLLGIARAGARLVAVGERGTVLLSDNNGVSWRQASVPVSTSLTAVQFVDGQQGWAVGHGGVVLHSSDAGEHWHLQLDGRRAAALELAAAQQDGNDQRLAAARRLVADGADKPLLALSFSDARHGLVTGAYGLALYTEDGGATWSSWAGRLPNPQGLHLYAVAQRGHDLWVAGEQGLVLHSSDGGGHFDALASPYEGSFFSLALLPDGDVLLGGLRGHLYSLKGDTFSEVGNPLPVSVNALWVSDQRLLLVNQAGAVLQGHADGTGLAPLPLAAGAPLNAVAEASDGSLIGVGFAGPLRLNQAPTLSSAE
ncbi:WD40/YVTN/BNR-like repeat-containing protein [Pseudomonas sp. M47T1]|uniref:WD40/YVTN/BNR-like repeat-containing protein n=1 Tax=Pseudomonas sp. M47T1 TaxID=1179778 RepID=UPI0002F6186B|nr:YCF48-related protein [Pseudomonas sp. M47T1]